MKKIILYTLCSCLLLIGCKRDKDKITTHDIKGMVFNNCTDSGLANVTVYLSDGQGLNLSTQSDANGSFNFATTKIYSSSKYKYSLNIPSKSGIGATTFEYCGFNGDAINFNSENISNNFLMKVTPKYLNFEIICSKIPTTNLSDSISFYCTNYIFHKNLPSSPYQWGGGGYGLGSYNNGAANYPMGKYNIDIDIWKSGVHTTKKDSVYLGWGSNTSYTINW